jgi:hypothetical protein
MPFLEERGVDSGRGKFQLPGTGMRRNLEREGNDKETF